MTETVAADSVWWDLRFAGLKAAAKTVIKNKSDKPKAPPRPELPRSEAAITLATTLSGGHRLTAVAAFKQPPSSSGRVPCTLTLAPKLPASVQALVPGEGLSLSGLYATSGSKATLKAAWKLALPISLVPPKKLRARPAKRPRDGGEEAPRPGSDIPPTDLAFSSADPFEELMAPA